MTESFPKYTLNKNCYEEKDFFDIVKLFYEN